MSFKKYHIDKHKPAMPYQYTQTDTPVSYARTSHNYCNDSNIDQEFVVINTKKQIRRSRRAMFNSHAIQKFTSVDAR